MQADSGFMARDPARHPPAIAPTRPLPPANTLSVVAGTRGDIRQLGRNEAVFPDI